MLNIDSEKLSLLVNEALESAEMIWEKHGDELKNFSEATEVVKAANSVQTLIPGYDSIEDDFFGVDNFVALVADMRDSTGHLLQAISTKKAKVSCLQRVFYETSALLPALDAVIAAEGGSVTEYLGDGVLGLFRVTEDSKSLYAALRAARSCVGEARKIVNENLEERYDLPPLNVGVGLAFSKAVVTIMGNPNSGRHPKVFGECVYRATKISGLVNEIVMDEALKLKWPTSKGGTLAFIPRDFKGVSGFVVEE